MAHIRKHLPTRGLQETLSEVFVAVVSKTRLNNYVGLAGCTTREAPQENVPRNRFPSSSSLETLCQSPCGEAYPCLFHRSASNVLIWNHHGNSRRKVLKGNRRNYYQRHILRASVLTTCFYGTGLVIWEAVLSIFTAVCPS